jgi:hypothetical protein
MNDLSGKAGHPRLREMIHRLPLAIGKPALFSTFVIIKRTVCLINKHFPFLLNVYQTGETHVVNVRKTRDSATSFSCPKVLQNGSKMLTQIKFVLPSSNLFTHFLMTHHFLSPHPISPHFPNVHHHSQN